MMSRSLSFFCLILLSVIFPGSLFGTAIGGSWEWRNPTPQANPLYRVTHGNDLFVAVGERGAILTSNAVVTAGPAAAGTEHNPPPGPAEEWIVRESGTRQWLTGATFAAGKFVVVGNAGKILTSSDGIEWTCQYSGTDEWLWDVTYFNDGEEAKFWAVGSGGTILSSPDGVFWSSHPQTSTRFLRSIARNENKTVVVGDAATVLYSEDGELWDQVDWKKTEQEIFSAIHSVTVGDGRFVAVGASGLILFSDDGEVWEEPEYFVTSQDLWHITYQEDPDQQVHGHFRVAGAGGSLLESEDGELWATTNTGVFNALRSVAFGDDRFVLVGSAGRIVRSLTEEEMEEMEDPPTEAWQDISQGVRNTLFDAVYGGEKFVVSGDAGLILRSVNQIDTDEFGWSTEFSGTSNWLRSITYAEQLFVAVGNNATIRTSQDAEAWASVFPELNGNIDAVAYGNGIFITVGRFGQIHLSEDGEIWTHHTPDYNPEEDFPAQWLRAVTYGAGLFVAVGDRGRILTSTNGNLWELQESNVTAPLFGVAYGDGKYIAVGRSGLILSSTNGEDWSFEDIDTFSTLRAVTYGNGTWVAVGEWGSIFASHDGEVWFAHNSRTNHSLWGVKYAEDLDLFVATGDGGTILTSTEADALGLHYWTWIEEQGMTGDDRWPERNPSEDGLQNLMKFALGLDPNLPERHMTPELEMIEDEEFTYLSLAFQEATDVIGVDLTLEASEDLVDWTDVDYWIVVLEEMEELDRRLVRFEEVYNIQEEDDRRFIRLRATLTDPFECSPRAPITGRTE